jgi:DNA-binding NarL/FixJ family response regulator
MHPSIAIVDDHELFRLGLVHLVEKNYNIPVTGQFKNGKEVLKFLESGHSIDLLILDLNMPVMSGTTLLAKLDKIYPQVKKLVLSLHADAMTISLCKDLGADGYLSKDVVWTDLEEAINEILAGGNYFITEDLINKSDPYNFQSELIIEQYRLTKREMQILQLILNEYLTAEIAEKLFASPYTIKTHRRNIFKKMGVRNLAGLITVLNESGYKNES